MTRLEFTPAALDDLERLTRFLLESDTQAAIETSALIFEAVEVLARFPRIGRKGRDGLRELVISRGRSAYLALYQFDELLDTVLVLAVRHQREADYN